MNEITTLSTIQEKVKEKIQQTFAELIPNDIWEGLVSTEIKEFIEKDLPNIVKVEAQKVIQELLKTEFAKPYWQEKWGGAGMEASEMVKNIIKETAPDLVANLFGSLVQNIVANIRNNPIRAY